MKMQLLTWNNAEPTPGPDTRPASSMMTGAGCRGENPRLRRREKNVLDNPFYRSGVLISGSAGQRRVRMIHKDRAHRNVGSLTTLKAGPRSGAACALLALLEEDHPCKSFLSM